MFDPNLVRNEFFIDMEAVLLCSYSRLVYVDTVSHSRLLSE